MGNKGSSSKVSITNKCGNEVVVTIDGWTLSHGEEKVLNFEDCAKDVGSMDKEINIKSKANEIAEKINITKSCKDLGYKVCATGFFEIRNTVSSENISLVLLFDSEKLEEACKITRSLDHYLNYEGIIESVDQYLQRVLPSEKRQWFNDYKIFAHYKYAQKKYDNCWKLDSADEVHTQLTAAIDHMEAYAQLENKDIERIDVYKKIKAKLDGDYEVCLGNANKTQAAEHYRLEQPMKAKEKYMLAEENFETAKEMYEKNEYLDSRFSESRKSVEREIQNIKDALKHVGM